MAGTLQPGSLFAGRYEIVRVIGQGGMGAVYEVVHKETLRRRALKVLLPLLVSDPDARARFAQEASITAEIDSEHIVETFDAGVDRESGCPFIVMELLRGETLGERLSRRQRHEAVDVVEILRQVALVLEQTHKRGIIHRDLKPDNLFLARREDGSCRIKVLDFGIAKVLERAALSRNTVNIGTPLYMAPEQLDGSHLSPSTDLFALTHIAFELLTTESYWEHEVRTAASTMVLLKWMEKGPPEPPRVRAARLGVHVGLDFDEWFYRGINPDQKARFRSARELVETFARALRVPLSLEAGRLSLTALVPSMADRSSMPDAGPHSAPQSAPARSTNEGTTMPRSVALQMRRSHGAFVTPVESQRRKASKSLLIAVGAGVASALGILVVVMLIATKSGGGAASATAKANAKDEGTKTATVTTDVSASLPATSEATIAVAPPTSAGTPGASASTTATTKTTARTAKPVRTAPRSDLCKRDPTRCRD